MAVEAGPVGFGHRLRPVERRDAADILLLRTDPEHGRWLNPTSGGVGDQEHWIEAQWARAGDYYFAIETLSGRWEGVVALYGVDDGSGEWGRWILRRGSLAAPASVLLLLSFGFDDLGLRRIYCRTLVGNLAVVGFHDACGYTRRSEGTYNDGRAFVEHSVLLPDWPAFRDTLAPMAERVARRGARL